MNKLYLITGPAGVGKSTISELLAEKSKKSALIEGDDIYNLVKGGYVYPWLENNHLEVFWENAFDIMENFLSKGYDVVFNYIIYKDSLELIRKRFAQEDIRFIVLMVNEKVILERDNLRNEDCRMGERSIVLLNEFKEQNFEKEYILDTSDLSVEDTLNQIDQKQFKLTYKRN